jgi:ankyrin repeat protein
LILAIILLTGCGKDIDGEKRANKELLQAIYNESMPRIKRALREGASVNYENEAGSTLGIATKEGNIEITEYLLSKGAKIKVGILHQTVSNFHVY